MTKWFDLGVSDPLALGMAHPLADRLETLACPKVNKLWARGATAALVMGIATLSAPLTIAENSPEKSLEDTVVTTRNDKSVIKIIKTDDDGNQIKKHYEIELKGDEFEAYEFDGDGNKRKVDASEIEGFNLEEAKNSKSWAFSIGDDNQLKFNSGKEAPRVFRLQSKDGNERTLKFLENDHAINLHHLESLNSLSNLKELKQLAELDELKNLKGLEENERLKLMQALEKIEGLESLDDLDGEISRVFVWNGDVPPPPQPPFPPGYKPEDNDVSLSRSFVFSKNKDFDGNPPVHFKMGDKDGYFMVEGDEVRSEAQLAAAKSMLETVEDMLKDIKLSEEDEDTKGDLRKVRRELKQAQKNLKDVESRLRNEKTAE